MDHVQPTQHIPVMADEIVSILAPALKTEGAVYVDCTTGLAGHAMLLLRAAPSARLIGIDRDQDALRVARERLSEFGDRVELVHAVYDEIGDVLSGRGIDNVSAILMDLGLSSLQIDRRERGFAYAVDAPLDMRMDASGSGLTAADVLHTYDEGELIRILRDFGEEKFAGRIAAAIVERRQRAPLTTSVELAELILDALPAAVRYREGGGHPAKRTFQALRIEVNSELEALASAVPQALRALGVGGRIAVLAYHSLEDRCIKRIFAEQVKDRAPKNLPVVPEELKPQFALLTKGAHMPSAQEIEENPRAASARLRAVERIRQETR